MKFSKAALHLLLTTASESIFRLRTVLPTTQAFVVQAAQQQRQQHHSSSSNPLKSNQCRSTTTSTSLSSSYLNSDSYCTTSQQKTYTLFHPRRLSNNNRILPTGMPIMTTTCTAIRGGSSSSLAATTTATTSSMVVDTTTQQPTEIFRRDYQPLPITVKTIDLDFQLYKKGSHDHSPDDGPITIVTTTMVLQRNPNLPLKDPSDTTATTITTTDDLVLDGDESSVTLLSLQINGIPAIAGQDYEQCPGKIVLRNIRSDSIITTVCSIVPEENTQLSGLYCSDDMYCTQCEAMGFRRITYYPDRPDNMAIFSRVRIEADQEDYPLLLSNGNLMEEGMVPTSVEDAANQVRRHYAIWSDPYPKPSYLFALVAGKLGSLQDTFTTQSGRTVQLNLYSEPNHVHKLQYAMDALKRSMRWDEERYGLEYDLDLFNIVAVDNFNMGAMENKSLNIFNTAYVLADTATATDTDFERVEAVIGHEYFHNWTGNRVTCRTLLKNRN
jgi:aminopeptidase N